MKPDPNAPRDRSLPRLAAAMAPILLLLILLPTFVETYQIQLVTYGLIAAIAALGFNLLLGYTGLLSFGHSAYFGIGAYTVAFVVQHLGPHSMEFYILIGIPAVAIVSALFGYVCVRHTRIFFGILTLAISQVVYSLALKLYWVTGGSDGLRVPRPALLLGLLNFSGPRGFQQFITSYYYYVLAIFVVCVVLMWVIVHSPFGKALQAIRDNETRAEFVGVQVWHYRWVAFVISGVFTGLAGALWVPLNGLTTPDILHWTFSGKMVFFTVLGGFQTFFGPVIGAIIFNYLENWAVGYTVYWQMVLGVVLVVLVLALPAGVVGTLRRLALRPAKAT